MAWPQLERLRDLGEPLTRKMKAGVAWTSLLAVASAFERAALHSPEVQKEIADWRDGFIFGMGILPDGPSISIQKKGSRIVYLGQGLRNPDVAFVFKNLDAALLVFTGQIGTHTAAVERRVIIHGNIGESMMVTRGLGMVQAYLFPAFIVDKTFRRSPKSSWDRMKVKARIMAELTPALVSNAFK
jgi:hypothetical protein